MTGGDDVVHFELGERRKELALVHGIAGMLCAARPFDYALVTELLALLPHAWQYPEVCEARIQLDELDVQTPAFIATPWLQRAPISGGRGSIEIVYREERPAASEGPFLREERELINTVAVMLSGHYDRWIALLALRTEEHQRIALEAQLRQAQKMEAVGRLAGGVAHDFNNILTIIAFNCELLLGGHVDSVGEAVTEIREATERATLLTRQLLAFSRKATLAPVVLDLNTLLTGLESMLRRLLGEDVTLRTAPAAEPASVRADRGQLEQIVMNLAINARDAMPNGGTLTLAVHVHRDTVDLVVADTGSGMDPATQARIFEPFFTTKDAERGTGLGLAVVHGIVQQAGGTIAVESELGRGTTFRIQLPRTRDAVTSESGSSSHAPTTGSETILVAEDDADLRRIIRVSLQAQGYRVLEARDGAQAIAIASAFPEPIQLLLIDVVLPAQPGREVAERLLAARPELVVVFMSGYTDDALIRSGVIAADVGFLQKPFTPSALASKVRTLLDG